MHEASIVGDLIRKASQVAYEHHATHLESLTVRVGGMSHVDPSSLAGQMAQAAEGTPVEGAVITVERGPQGSAALADEHAADVVLVSVEVAR